jgi:type IV secretion system protein VirB4
MKIPFLDLLKFKEAENQLKYVTPYSFIMTPGVCFFKKRCINDNLSS